MASLNHGFPEADEDRVQVEPHSAGSSLPLLYQGLLTGIVRIGAHRQRLSDTEVFRRKTKSALQQLEREAIAAGYHSEDVKDTHFAIVAFLDEVILNGEDPVRGEWERHTLQQDLFGLTDAGVVFFDKLENLVARHDSARLADVLEVYLLCMLLGFQGRYSGRQRAELESIIERTRKRIDRIRGSEPRLSPNGELPPRTPEPDRPVPRRRMSRLEIAAAITAVATLILFIVFKLNLVWAAEEVGVNLAPR